MLRRSKMRREQLLVVWNYRDNIEETLGRRTTNTTDTRGRHKESQGGGGGFLDYSSSRCKQKRSFQDVLWGTLSLPGAGVYRYVSKCVDSEHFEAIGQRVPNVGTAMQTSA